MAIWPVLQQGINMGDAMMLIATLAYALYSTLLKYWQMEIPALQLLYLQILVASDCRIVSAVLFFGKNGFKQCKSTAGVICLRVCFDRSAFGVDACGALLRTESHGSFF